MFFHYNSRLRESYGIMPVVVLNPGGCERIEEILYIIGGHVYGGIPDDQLEHVIFL